MKKMEGREKNLLHGITIVFSTAVIGLTIALVILGKLFIKIFLFIIKI